MEPFVKSVKIEMLLVGTILLLSGGYAQAQEPVKNPTAVLFTCPDHDRDDQHEIDIIRVSDGQVVQTLLVGDPPVNGNGDVRVAINVMPVAFGQYVIKVRAVAGTLKSEDSVASEVWVRSPGKPSKPRTE